MNIKTNHSLLGSLFAFILATSCCWLPWLAIGIGSATGLVGFTAGLERFSGLFMVASVAFLTYALYQFYQKNQSQKIVLQSVLTCPNCGIATKETMPTDACHFFYDCKSCQTILKPKAGDCCVYCSYGTVVCPPMQNGDCAC